MTDLTPGLHLCRRCHLSSTCRAPVPGEGPAPARVLLLGEAPGADEDLSGRPFVGRSGRLLRDTLLENGVDPRILYITNSVKCRPPGNAKPKVKETGACAPWLRMEIAAVKPELIVAIGETSLRALFGSGRKAKYGKLGVEDARRREDLLYDDTVPVQAIYHPAAALRSPRMRAGFMRDVEKLAERLGLKTAVDQSRDYAIYEGFTADMTDQVIALDTEYDKNGLYCYSFSYQDTWGRVVFARLDPGARPILEEIIDTAETLVFHNAKADVPVLCDFLGIPHESWPWERTHDTAVMAYVLNKKPVALKDLADNLLGLRVTRLDELRGVGSKNAIDFDQVDRDDLVKYSAQDADLTLRLYAVLSTQLEETATHAITDDSPTPALRVQQDHHQPRRLSA